MDCVVCGAKINAATYLQIWVENSAGALVKLGRYTPAVAHLCASYQNQRNVCQEALDQGRTYLNDDEVAERCSSTGKILRKVI